MQIEPIAYIKTDFTDKFGIPRQSGRIREAEGEICFYAPYSQYNYIRGIEQYSHIWVIWGFSENEGARPRATVRPPRLGGNERIGVFASRSPFRPNALALSCVELKEVRRKSGGCSLIIAGADMLSGSPIYDIKPYIAYTDCVEGTRGGFAEEQKSHRLDIKNSEMLEEHIPQSKLAALLKILEDDPRPAYQHDPKRIYALEYAGYGISFCVDGGRLEIKECKKTGE